MKTAVVIGGGASGLMTAITLAEHYKGKDLKIIIAERMDRVGKKLAATGNGTCNITNVHCTADRYHGESHAAERLIDRFSPEDAISFFASVGVLCQPKEDGRVYPYSRQATSVLDCLRARAVALGIEERCKTEIIKIKKSEGGFKLFEKEGISPIYADAVIVTAGGKTAPSLGGSESGYNLLTSLGHSVTKLSPAIVQLKTETGKIRALKGVKTDAYISLKEKGSIINRQYGEVLFTEYGISGPPVLQLSRPVGAQGGSYTVQIDFMPEYTQQDIFKLLLQRKKDLSGGTLESFLTGMLNKRIGQTIAKEALKMPLSSPCNGLSEGEIQKIAEQIKGFCLAVSGTLSWQNAQVTAGGVKASEFNLDNMQSRLCGGVFAAGEIINVDGDCGGFNLQWAWSSGYAAGKGAAEYLCT